MNIRCPSCQTTFRVDPARIPASGVRARCSRCGNAFTIQPPSATPAAVGSTMAAGEAQPPAPAVPQQPPVSPPQPSPVAAAATPQPVAPAAPRPVSPPPAPATPPRTPVFGARDPNARAQRIARALVSDIVAYHKKKVEEALSAGTMRTEFREEIMKSWEEYVAQVGLELAKSTPYFRNALNEILARGQQVF